MSFKKLSFLLVLTWVVLPLTASAQFVIDDFSIPQAAALTTVGTPGSLSLVDDPSILGTERDAWILNGSGSPSVNVTGGVLSVSSTADINAIIMWDGNDNDADPTASSYTGLASFDLTFSGLYDTLLIRFTAASGFTGADDITITISTDLNNYSQHIISGTTLAGIASFPYDYKVALVNAPGAFVQGGFATGPATFTNVGEMDLAVNSTGAAISAVGVDLIQVFGPETVISVDGSGNLVINDVNGGASNDNWTLSRSGANYVLTDNNGSTIDCDASVAPCTNGGTASVTIDGTAFTGSILINGLGGNDQLTVDFGGGNMGNPITFTGGNPVVAVGGDRLVLTGGGLFANSVHTATGAGAGNVAITGNSTVAYTGLEPVTDATTVANRTFILPDGGSTCNLADGAGATMDWTNSAGVGFESINFTNPTVSLTIIGGAGSDIINVNSMDMNGPYAGSLTITANAGTDDVTFANFAFPTLSAITVTVDRTITVNGSIVTTTGAMTLLASGTPAGDYTGLELDVAVITSTSGNISLTGTGRSTGATSDNPGVYLDNASVSTASGGTITFNGTGGNGIDRNYGVSVANVSSVSTANGAILFTGTAGAGSGTFNAGVRISASDVQATGLGTLTFNGNGNTGTDDCQGVRISSGAFVQTNSGLLTLNGTAGNGTGLRNVGIMVISGATVSSTSGNHSFIGLGGNGGASGNHGIQVTGAGSNVTSGAGTITMTGTGQGTGANNYGIVVDTDGLVTTTGAGNISLTGTGGTGTSINLGVFVETGADITTTGGLIDINGFGGAGSGDFDHGVAIVGGTSSVTSTTGVIDIFGQGGATGDANVGISIDSGQVTTGGNIIINGTGGAGTNSNWGVFVGNAADVIGWAGTLAITGTGGNGTGDNNWGVFVGTGADVTGGAGALAITGTGGNGAGQFNYGIRVSGAGTSVSTTAGALGFLGNASGTGSTAVGVVIESSSTVNSTTGPITLTGNSTATGGTAFGLRLETAASVTTDGGTITLNGSSSTIEDVYINTAGVLGDNNTGAIIVNGDGGTGGVGPIAIGNAVTSAGTQTYNHTTAFFNTAGITMIGASFDFNDDVIFGVNPITFNAAVTVADDWTNNGGFAHNGQTITFDGNVVTGNQTLTGATTFFGLTLNNTSATGLIIAASNMAIATGGTITLNNGILDLSNNIILNFQGPVSVVNSNTASFVAADRSAGGTTEAITAAYTGGTTQIFPTGVLSRNSYMPTTLVCTSGETFTVFMLDQAYPNGTGGTALPTGVVRGTWDVTATDGSVGSMTMKVQWNSGDEAALFSSNYCRLAHFIGGAWDNFFAGASTPAGSAKSFTRPNITGAVSPFSMFGNGGIVPTMGEWALIIMTLVFLSLGTIALRRYAPSPVRPEINR